MSRKFIAAVLVAATTLTAFSAAPARATTDEDIARLLGAAATIFIIGKAIETSRDRDEDRKKKKKKNKPVVVHKNHKDHGHITRHRDFHSNSYHNNSIPYVVPRHTRPHHKHLAALPQCCVRRIEGGSVRRVVMGRCLERNYASAHPLPHRCKMTVATHRGDRRAYALPCLRDRGYTIARN